MERDPRVICMGEDVGKMGGVFQSTAGLHKKFPDRVLDTPISETGIMGAALGAASAGLRPVAELMFVDFMGVCFGQIMNEIGKATYMSGGAVTFFSMRIAGRMVDRFGSPRVAAAATALFLAVLGLAFLPARPALPVVAAFVGFMLCNSTRNVALSSLATRVPRAEERARFLSVQSAVQHLASSLGAILSSRLLSEGPGGRLLGIERVAAFTMTLALALPVLLWLVEGRVVRSERAPALAPAIPP